MKTQNQKKKRESPQKKNIATNIQQKKNQINGREKMFFHLHVLYRLSVVYYCLQWVYVLCTNEFYNAHKNKIDNKL